MPSPPDPVEVAWEELQEAWDDPSAHGRFIALCSGLDRLESAGARYRAVRDGQDEERRAEAGRQIGRIVATAMAGLATQRKPERPGTNTTLLMVALAVFLALVGGVTWAVLSGL